MAAVSCVNMKVIGVLLWCFINVRGSELQETGSNQTTETPEEKQGVDTTFLQQADGFSSNDIIRIGSGPIVLLDKCQILVSNLRYQPVDNNTRFCVNGSFSSEGTTVWSGDKSTNIVSSYYGSAVRLWFPEHVTLDNVECFGICDDYKFLVSVNLTGTIDSDELSECGSKFLHEEQNVFGLPRCCAKNEELNEESKCHTAFSPQELTNVPFLQSNRTHVNLRETIDSAILFSYHYPLNCLPNEISLEWGNLTNIYGITFNMSLLANEVTHLIPLGSYCLEQKSNETIVAICYKFPPAAAASFTANIYLILLVISSICFAVSAWCYWFVLPAKSNSLKATHKKCFVGYSTSMCLTFFTLILLHIIDNQDACNALGSIFLLCNTMSFAWLTLLCVDLIYIVRNFETDKVYGTWKFYVYVGMSVGIALLILIISLCIQPSGVPDVPAGFIKNTKSSCDFKDSKLIIFYLPVSILIVISGIALVVTKWFIYRYEQKRESKTNHFWCTNQTNFKFMWCQGAMTLLVATVSACLELVLNLIEPSVGYFFTTSITESVQGVFIILIFFTNHYHKKVSENTMLMNSRRNNVVLQPLKGIQETI